MERFPVYVYVCLRHVDEVVIMSIMSTIMSLLLAIKQIGIGSLGVVSVFANFFLLFFFLSSFSFSFSFLSSYPLRHLL